ncbi:MAG: outer membrane beta-barrel protein [Bacteroidota bacterium]
MKSEQEFDDFIKNKLSDESAFPFEEDKWARMEEMIIAAEEKKKRRGFFWIFFSGFITALVIIIPFTWYILTSKEDPAKADEDQALTQGKSKNLKNGKQELSKTGEDQNQSKTPKLVAENKASSEKSNSDKTDEVKFVKESKSNLTVKVKKNQNVKKVFKAEQEDNSVVEIVKETIIDNTLAKEELRMKEKEVKTQDSIAKLTIINDSISQIKKDSTANSIVEKQEVIKVDTVSATKNKDEIFEKGFSFYASFGAHFNLGFSKNDGNSFSPYISATMKYRFSPVWSLISGFGYYQVANLNFEKQIVQRTYDFGYRDIITSISQQKLHYVTIPIEISRKWNKSNLGFGINPTILIANKSELSTQEKTSLREMEKNSSSSFKHGHGLNTFDLQFSLSYSYDLGKRIAVGTSFRYGILDVRDDSWTENSDSENNKTIQLNVIYKIK